MRTTHWTIGFRELFEQPLHLILFERRIHFDCRMARDGSGNPAANYFHVQRLLLAVELIEQLVNHVLDLRSLHSRRRGLDGDGARTERLHFKAVPLQLFGDLDENRLVTGCELDDQAASANVVTLPFLLRAGAGLFRRERVRAPRAGR